MRRKPNILVINTTDTMGGAAKVSWQLGKEIERRGYSVKYLVSRKYSDSPHVAALNSDSHHLRSMFPRYLRSFVTSSDLDQGSPDEILAHPWYQEADIVHLHNLHGSYFPLAILPTVSQRKKVIWTLHDMWPICPDVAYSTNPQVWQKGESGLGLPRQYPFFLFNRAKYLWHKKKSLYQKSRLNLVSPSEWLAGIVKDKSILASQSLTVIHNGVDPTFFTPTGGSASSRRTLLFVTASLSDRRKGWDLVRALAKRHPDLDFVATGGAKESHTNNLTILPKLSRLELLKRYHQANGLIIAAEAENQSLAVLEAASCGLPLVGFAAAGTLDFVSGEQEELITTTRTLTSLSQVVDNFLKTPSAQLAAIGEKNRRKVIASYNTNKFYDQYENLYQKVFTS